MNNNGGTFGASFVYGAGRVALFTDEEMFMDPPAVGGLAAPNAYVIPDERLAVPGPATLLLLGGGLAVLLWRRKKD